MPGSPDAAQDAVILGALLTRHMKAVKTRTVVGRCAWERSHGTIVFLAATGLLSDSAKAKIEKVVHALWVYITRPSSHLRPDLAVSGEDAHKLEERGPGDRCINTRASVSSGSRFSESTGSCRGESIGNVWIDSLAAVESSLTHVIWLKVLDSLGRTSAFQLRPTSALGGVFEAWEKHVGTAAKPRSFYTHAGIQIAPDDTAEVLGLRHGDIIFEGTKPLGLCGAQTSNAGDGSGGPVVLPAREDVALTWERYLDVRDPALQTAVQKARFLRCVQARFCTLRATGVEMVPAAVEALKVNPEEEDKIMAPESWSEDGGEPLQDFWRRCFHEDFLPYQDSEEDSDFTADESCEEGEDEPEEAEEQEMRVSTDDEAQMVDVSEVDPTDVDTDNKDEKLAEELGVHGGHPLLDRVWSRMQELDEATMEMFRAEHAFQEWLFNASADGEAATDHVMRLYSTRCTVQVLMEEVRHLGQQLP